MIEIKWDSRLETGDETVDRQHIRLFELVNELTDAIEAGTAPEAIRGFWIELVRYTNTHFIDEESLMEACRYEGLAEHRAQHADLTGQTRVLAEYCWSENVCEPLDLAVFLYDWLVQHILQYDIPMIEQVRELAAAS